MCQFKEKKAVYDEKVEDKMYKIINDSNLVIPALEKLYDETRYPGILCYLGQAYIVGFHELENQKDEEKGIEYLKRAAEDNYIEAMEILGSIYTGKAEKQLIQAQYWYDQLGLDYNDSYGKFCLGTNFMAQYLIATPGTHYNYYDQYYNGLGLVAESFQMGCSEAYFILKVLDKDKELMKHN